MDPDLRDALDQHEHRVERMIARIVHPVTMRLERIEKKIDKTNARVSNIERRHIEVDARVDERHRLAQETATAAAEQTQAIFEERSWSFKKKATVATLAVASISVAVPLMTAVLHAIL